MAPVISNAIPYVAPAGITSVKPLINAFNVPAVTLLFAVPNWFQPFATLTGPGFPAIGAFLKNTLETTAPEPNVLLAILVKVIGKALLFCTLNATRLFPLPPVKGDVGVAVTIGPPASLAVSLVGSPAQIVVPGSATIDKGAAAANVTVAMLEFAGAQVPNCVTARK